MDNNFHTVRGYQLMEQNKNKITSAMEDYLEMIYRNTLQDGYIRINKLAELLNVRASSASKIVQKLGFIGLLNYERYGIITLSETGKEMGAFLLERHKIIEDFLKFLGCSEDSLIQTELIEHSLNVDTVRKIQILNSFFSSNRQLHDLFKDYKSKNE